MFRIGKTRFAVALVMQFGADRMPLPGCGAAVAIVSLAGALIGPSTALHHLLAVTNLHHSTGTGVHASLLHHFFELFASFGSHVVHVSFILSGALIRRG